MSSRKYGGINNLNNAIFTVNSLVTNDFTLKNAYKGAFVVNGTLRVSGDTTLESNVIANSLYVPNGARASSMTVDNGLYAKSNVDISGNLYVLNGNIYANRNVDVSGTLFVRDKLEFKSVYLASDSSGNLGINTTTPISTLDIVGNNTRSINVSTTRPTNFNVLASNNANRGISLYADSSSSIIGFYNDRAIHPESSADASIKYVSPGVLEIDVSSNTAILSRMSVSTDGRTDHKLNETAIVYDDHSRTSSYLFDSYESNTAKTGNTLTLCSTDVSANTFINIIATDNRGIGIGGGNYLNDQTRAFGTIGVVHPDKGYYPAMNIVSGNSRIRQKTTLGINTHTPVADTYSVDLNGPMYIHNGEITVSIRIDTELMRMGISRTHPQYGVAIGAPIFMDGKYNHKILYTNDGGNMWNVSTNLNDTTIVDTLTIFKDVYVYDNILSIIVGQNGVVEYSINGGRNWSAIGGFSSDLLSVYISSSRRVYIGTAGVVHWFDIPINITNDGFTPAIQSFTPGFSVNRISGYDDVVYFIGGNRIEWRSASNNYQNIQFRTLPGTTYNALSVINNQTVVAVGSNAISYTRNGGTTWTDIAQTTPLNSVYMYDETHSIAVGDRGRIIYSSDSNQTWQTIPDNIIRSSGNANLLLDSSYNLFNVVMTDITNIIVCKRITAFQQIAVDLDNTIIISGNTSVIHCYVPSLFNNIQNTVLNVFGSAQITGDANLTGSITTDLSSFYLVNANAKSVFFANDASSVSVGSVAANSQVVANRDLVVRNNAIINQNATVSGNTTIQNRLFVFQDASMSTNATVIGNVNVGGKLTAGRMTILGDASLNKDVYVVGNTFLNNALTVSGVSTFKGIIDASSHVTVGGNTTLNGPTATKRLYTTGDASFSGGIFDVFSPATFRTTTNTLGIATFQNKTTTWMDASFMSDVDIAGKLTVQKSTIFQSDLKIVGKTTALGTLYGVDASFGGNMTITGPNLLMTGDASFNKNMFVGQNQLNAGDVKIQGKLAVDNVIYSTSYEGAAPNKDIYIGSMGLYNESGTRTIFIGNNGTTQNSRNVIRIGGGEDTVVLGGGGSGVGIENISAGKTITVNTTGNTNLFETSAGAGLLIMDNSSNKYAGHFIVSNDLNGFIFKATKNITTPNIVKLDVNSITLPENIQNGLLTVSRSKVAAGATGTAAIKDSNYTITSSLLDVSNIAVKRYLPADDAAKLQVMDSSMGVQGNMYATGNLSVGKTTATANYAMDVSGSTLLSKLSIATKTAPNANYMLELSGNMFHTNGFIWQF